MNRFVKGAKTYLKENASILIGLFVLSAIVAVMSKSFLTPANILNVLRQLFSNCNLALGMCLVILTGGIDLSVGAVMALSGTLCAGLIANGTLPVAAAILLGLVLGVLVGVINGCLISKLGIAPFVVTLATQQICRGLIYVYANGLPIRCMNETFNFLGNGYIGEIPITIIYSLIFVVAFWLLLSHSQLGRHIYAVGGNITAARFSGINVDKVRIIVYSISAFMASFAGIIYCARMYSGQPTLGNGDETDAIAAVVLGGTSMSGGVGKIGGTVIGILIIAVLSNALNLLKINSFWQLVAKGIVILIAVCIDNLKTTKRSKG